MWSKFMDGETIGTVGSEGGEILIDELHDNGGRITLEKTTRLYAITCGIFGVMVHTAIAGEDEYMETYEAMKSELGEFLSKDTTSAEDLDFLNNFTDKCW